MAEHSHRGCLSPRRVPLLSRLRSAVRFCFYFRSMTTIQRRSPQRAGVSERTSDDTHEFPLDKDCTEEQSIGIRHVPEAYRQIRYFFSRPRSFLSNF